MSKEVSQIYREIDMYIYIYKTFSEKEKVYLIR